jgi:thiol-disulfide isomerase/thioredoxin
MNNEGDVCIIRPLAYTRELQTKEFAYGARLPVINENCPACFEEPKERHRVKKMLANEESLCPSIYANMRRALIPFMDNSIYRGMKIITTTVQGRRQKQGGSKNPRALEAKKSGKAHEHGGADGSQWSLRQPRLPGSKRKQLQLLRAQLKEEGRPEADTLTNHALLALLQERGGLSGGAKEEEEGGDGGAAGKNDQKQQQKKGDVAAVEEGVEPPKTLWGCVALDAMKELDDATLLRELKRRGVSAAAVAAATGAGAGSGGGGSGGSLTSVQKVQQKRSGSIRAVWAEETVGKSLLRPAVSTEDGGASTLDLLHGASSKGVVALYFSAKWCPPCREFTPLLKELYTQHQQNATAGSDFEVVFVSADRTRSKFEEYASTMPWLAIPFEVSFRHVLYCPICTCRIA